QGQARAENRKEQGIDHHIASRSDGRFLMMRHTIGTGAMGTGSVTPRPNFFHPAPAAPPP
ncbi:hypothetical protein, partial [Streptomyces rubiginosohelvolus]